MNYRYVAYQLGLILLVLAAALGLTTGVELVGFGWDAGERRAVAALGVATLLTGLAGAALWYAGRAKVAATLHRRDARDGLLSSFVRCGKASVEADLVRIADRTDDSARRGANGGTGDDGPADQRCADSPCRRADARACKRAFAGIVPAGAKRRDDDKSCCDMSVRHALASKP